MTRRDTEEELLERRLEMLTRAARVGIFRTDAAGSCAYVNGRWSELTGLGAEEARGEGWKRGLHPEDRAKVEAQWLRATAEKRPFEAECRFVLPDGEVRWLTGRAEPELDAEGEVQAYIGTMTDVTATRLAQQAAREREANIVSILDAAVDGIVLIDERGTIEVFNTAAQRMFGYAEDAVRGRNVRMLMPSPDRDRHDEYLRAYLRTGEARIIGIGREVEGRRKDGSTFPLHLAVSEVPGERRRFTGILRDISARKLAEQELHESRRTLATLISNIPGLAYRCRGDRERTMEFVSRGCLELTGHTPVDLVRNARVSFGSLIHPDDLDYVLEEIRSAVAERLPFRLQYRISTASGDQKWVWEQGCGVFGEAGELEALEGLITDTTERKQLEEEFLQAQKMEAIGRLAGGIAHDFNNLLTGIISGCRIAEDLIEGNTEAANVLGQIRREARRGAGMTRQLLDFSRKRPIQRQELNLNDIVAESEEMLRKLLDEDVELVVELDPFESRIVADPGQMEQMLMNLSVNARDAMPDGGTLSLRVSSFSAPESRPGLPSGEYVLLSVADDGCGMDDRTRARIFEPFFTTKGVGKGTGLGLSTVFGMVQEFGGFIDVESRVGQGSVFQLYFPRVEGTARDAAPDPQRAPPAGSGSGTILVVEDEPLVRAGIRHFLRSLGYRVLDAKDPKVALRMCREHAGEIDVLLTDIVMPGMSGTSLAREVQAMRPAVRVLYMSAYSDEALVEQGRVESGVAVLEKPFEESELARRIRAAMKR